MRRAILLLIAAASAASLAIPADAAPRRSRVMNDIVITKRSYFDAGVLVKPGSLSGALNYVSASQNATPPYANINSQFGAETLPLPGALPGCCGVPFARFQD
jgi:hypothetical protein